MVGTLGMPSGLGPRFRLGSSGRSCCSCTVPPLGAVAASAALPLQAGASVSFSVSRPTDMVGERRLGAANGSPGVAGARSLTVGCKLSAGPDQRANNDPMIAAAVDAPTDAPRIPRFCWRARHDESPACIAAAHTRSQSY